MICKECYSELNRITHLTDTIKCLSDHTQYICSTCGRCICFEKDSKRNVMRWNFPFTTLENAKLYLRAADYYCKKNCGIYKLTSDNGRVFYKIFKDEQALNEYLHKNKDKSCKSKKPVFVWHEYIEFTNTEVRKLTKHEIRQYFD